MRMGIMDILPVAIANINIVNVTNIVQNYIVFSHAKHKIDTVVSKMSDDVREARNTVTQKNYNIVIALSY